MNSVALAAGRECWCTRKTTSKKLIANKKLFAIPTLKTTAPIAVAA